MEGILQEIANNISELSNNIRSTPWYNSSWFTGLLGLGGVVLGVFLDRYVRSRISKDADNERKLMIADGTIRFQFSQLLPRLEKVQREVDLYPSGSAPNIVGETGWTSVKGTLIQYRVDEKDDFMSQMDRLAEMQRHLSPQVGWPNVYTEEIKKLLILLVDDCKSIVRMSPFEVVERFKL